MDTASLGSDSLQRLVQTRIRSAPVVHSRGPTHPCQDRFLFVHENELCSRSADVDTIEADVLLHISATSEEKAYRWIENHTPAFTIIGLPNFKAVPEIDGTNSETFVIVDFSKQLVLIGGTKYAGEINFHLYLLR